MPAATDIAPARPSSTVVLVREGKPLPEIFMVKRHARSSFGSAFAFPGGVVEQSDRKVHAFCTGRTSAEATAALSVEDNALDYFSAAARELFEEAGVLLGTTTKTARELAVAREQLNDGSLLWDRFAVGSSLQIDCAVLRYFSFWITPVQAAKRYSARFFLAQLPVDQQADHCGGELTDSCWMTASAVLAAAASGAMRVHYPTRKTLESLAQLATVAALKKWATSTEQAGVACIQPTAVPNSER